MLRRSLMKLINLSRVPSYNINFDTAMAPDKLAGSRIINIITKPLKQLIIF